MKISLRPAPSAASSSSSIPLKAGAGRLFPVTDSGHTATPSSTIRTPQQHGSYPPGQPERHETPDPRRSSAVKPRLQCVRQRGTLLLASASNPATGILTGDLTFRGG